MDLFADSLTIAWVWQPMAPTLRIYAGCGLMLVLTLFAYVRVAPDSRLLQSLLLTMRLGTILALGVLLMGPSHEVPQSDLEQDSTLTVLLDTSESMRTADCGTDSRIGFIAQHVLNEPQRQRLQDGFQLHLLGWDERLHPVSSTTLAQTPEDLAQGRATLLAESVVAALSQSRPGEGDAILLISDGRDTEDASMQQAAALAKSKEMPIYTVGVGGTESTADAAVLAVPMQEFLLPNEPGGILVKVYQSGLDDRSTVVRLKQGDTTEQFPVDFNGQPVVELQIPVQQESAGEYQYEITLDTLEDEAESSNNEQIVFCDVMKRRIRVLILEGQPFWDSRFPAQSLRKDERIELTQITQVSGIKRETIVSRVEDRSPQLPDTDPEWAEYDVVILGRGMEHLLDSAAAEQLVQFVREGAGHLILCRGRCYDPETAEGKQLEETMRVLEPVVWGTGQLQELSLSLTASGRVSQWLTPVKMGLDAGEAFERLPGFDVMPAIEREKPGTLVLARASTEAGPPEGGTPALVTMNYGRGTVAAILGEGHWKWSLLPPEDEDLRGFYDTFWSNLVRWLAIGGDFEPGKQIALTLSRGTARLGDEVTVDVSYKHDPADGQEPMLELIDPDGETSDLPLYRLPGGTPRFRSALEPQLIGTHVVRLRAPGMTPGELTKRLSVYDVNLERLQTAANPLTLQVLAEHSGGAYFRADEIGDLDEQLKRHRLSMLAPPRREYVWDRGVIMTVLLIWIGLEWIFRRLAGLW